MGGRLILDLPKYCSAFKDRHGKTRIRFRRAGCKTRYFVSSFPSRDFDHEYQSYLDDSAPAPADRRKIIRGSVDDLALRFMASTSFRGNATTKTKKRAIIGVFQTKHGHRPVATCPYVALDKYISALATKDEKGRGGPEAADRARKTLKKMFDFAVKLGWRSDNPMAFVEPTNVPTDGFHCWTEDEIQQYQDYHALGTMARLAMEIMLWTGRRPTDASRLGKQHRQGQFLEGRDAKTRKPWRIRIAQPLAQAIAAMPETKHLNYILNAHGRPFSQKGFNNRMRAWCDQAGLPKQCQGHGLRKAYLTRIAESGATQQQIKAVSLHSNDREVATYVERANQALLAEAAMTKLERFLANRHEN